MVEVLPTGGIPNTTQLTNSSNCSAHQESCAMKGMGRWNTSSTSGILEIAVGAVPAVPSRQLWVQ